MRPWTNVMSSVDVTDIIIINNYQSYVYLGDDLTMSVNEQ